MNDSNTKPATLTAEELQTLLANVTTLVRQSLVGGDIRFVLIVESGGRSGMGSNCAAPLDIAELLAIGTRNAIAGAKQNMPRESPLVALAKRPLTAAEIAAMGRGKL